MAKITDLPAAGALTGAELMPLVQGASTKRTTVAAVGDLIVPGMSHIVDVYFSGNSGDATIKAAQAKVRITAANTLSFAGMTIYAVPKRGGLPLSPASSIIAHNPAGGLVGTYVFGDDDRLLLVKDGSATGSVIKVGVTANQPADDYIVLAHYKAGAFKSGALLPQIQDELAARRDPCAYIVYSGLPTPSSYTGIPTSVRDVVPRLSGNVLTFTMQTFFAADESGATIKQFRGFNDANTGYSNTFVMRDNDRLIWDWTPGLADQIRLINTPLGDVYPWRYVALGIYKNGRFVATEPGFAALIAQSMHSEFTLDTAEERVLVINSVPKEGGGTVGVVADQGAVVVGDKLMTFNQSEADHSNYATIGVYSKEISEGFRRLGTMTHNFGHAGSVDYCPETDTAVWCNGELTTSIAVNILELVPGFSAYGPGAVLNYNDQVGTPRIPIALYAVDGGGNPIKQLLGNAAAGGPVACFTDRRDEIYVWQGVQVIRPLMYRLRLGMGAIDYSDATGTDQTRWGTFIAGKTANEYNGTAKVVGGPFETPYYSDYVQGLAWHDGELFFPYTSLTRKIVECAAFKLSRSGQPRITREFRHVRYGAGDVAEQWETEGACVIDGKYLLVTANKYGSSQTYWAVFPLTDHQDGKGVVGTRITFPFPCETAPSIRLDRSGAGDVYVDPANIDRLGFTASGAVGATFRWACRIT